MHYLFNLSIINTFSLFQLTGKMKLLLLCLGEYSFRMFLIPRGSYVRFSKDRHSSSKISVCWLDIVSSLKCDRIQNCNEESITIAKNRNSKEHEILGILLRTLWTKKGRNHSRHLLAFHMHSRSQFVSQIVSWIRRRAQVEKFRKSTPLYFSTCIRVHV